MENILNKKNATVNKEIKQNEEYLQRCYIGDTIIRHGLAHCTVYKEIPPHINSLIEKNPFLSNLFVPIGDLSGALQRLNKREALEYQANNQLKEIK